MKKTIYENIETCLMCLTSVIGVAAQLKKSGKKLNILDQYKNDNN